MPGATVPDGPEPDVPEPDVPEPGGLEPDGPEPDGTEPARTVPGIDDVARLGRWLAEKGIAGNGGPPRVTLILGGRSNLTYLVEGDVAGGDTWRLVLRRPPLGHVLPTAHDMGREYTVLTALGTTDIPAPAVLALCDDPSVIGAPFYLMEHRAGRVLRSEEDGKQISPAQAQVLSEQFADMLAAIHSVDVPAAGLANFGRPDGYMERQFARWQRQWELSATREMPGYAELVGRLASGLPGTAGNPHPEGTLLHGDYRLDNMLVVLSERPQITAVLDWEMSTLGDPLADLGLALVYWGDAGDTETLDLNVAAAITSGPGYLRREQLADRYAARTGRDLSHLGYYMAFGCFKLAVVLEGIYARFLQHQTVGEGFEREGLAVPSLIGRAHRLLDSLG